MTLQVRRIVRETGCLRSLSHEKSDKLLGPQFLIWKDEEALGLQSANTMEKSDE